MKRTGRIFLTIVATALFISCSKSKSDPSTNPIIPPPAPQDSLYSWTKSGPIDSILYDVWITENKTGYTTNGSNLYNSTDNGNTWNIVPNTRNAMLINLQFLDDQYGFLQGYSLMEYTTDGGMNWTTKTMPTPQVLYSQFVSPVTGFYFDMNAGMYKTTDGGNHWNSILPIALYPNHPYPFFFLDSLNGFTMVSNNFSRTIDGGAHWEVISSHEVVIGNAGVFKMQFLDLLIGYCGASSGLYKTTDGGKNWTNSLPSTKGFVIPQFFDVNNGYCLIGNTIYKTTDGGLNWTISCKLGTGTFYGMHFIDMNTGLACTTRDFVIKLGL